MAEEFKIDPNADPKNSFINFLIWEFKNITPILYSHNRYAIEAPRALRGLIDNLDEKDKEALKEEYDKLRGFERSVNTLSRTDIEDIYRSILSYVHKKYLQEVFAMPRNPNPSTVGE
jgi:hypothetical protein